MNCDEAFDRMTLPGAATDVALDRHLARCARCRAMQETLSPAIKWLLPADDFGDSELRRPAFLSDEAVQIAERAARGLSRSAVGSRVRRPLRRLLTRWLAWGTVAAMAFLAVFISQSTGPHGSDNAVAPVAPAEGCLWQMPLARGNSTLPTARQVVASCVACHGMLPQ